MCKTAHGDIIEEEGEVFIEYTEPHGYEKLHRIRLMVCGVEIFGTVAQTRAELCVQPPTAVIRANTQIGAHVHRWYITLEDVGRLIEDAWPSE